MLTLCYSKEDSDSIGGMAESEAAEASKLKEVYTRWLVEQMGDMKPAEFSRRTGISKPELSTVKAGDRKATEGQVIKVCGSVGPRLSVALGQMTLIARDVEAELAKQQAGHVTLENANSSTATLVTATGRKLTVRLDAAADTAKTIDAESEPTRKATESTKKKTPRKRSRPESARPRSTHEAPPHRPSPRS